MRIRPQIGERGLTLVEVAVALAIGAIVLFAAWVAWEISWRESYAASDAAIAQRNAYSALRRIEQEVMRAEGIQVPDPDYAALPSIQLLVPTEAGRVRRAFRLVDDSLIIHLKDEGVASYEAFDGLTGFVFNVLDPPTDSQIEIVCMAASKGQSVTMRSVATRRN